MGEMTSWTYSMQPESFSLNIYFIIGKIKKARNIAKTKVRIILRQYHIIHISYF